MIVTFSVENFRSFHQEQTLSFVASKKLSDTHPKHLVKIPGSDQSALRVGVVYGANGAGKSNLFKALEHLTQHALRGFSSKKGTAFSPFKLASDTPESSTFDLQFITNNKLYRFGLTTTSEKISEEWLIEIRGKKEKVIYERTTSDSGEVKVESKNLSGKVKALATVGSKPQRTFLATINSTIQPKDFEPDIGAVIEWFKERIDFIGPESKYGSLGLLLHKNKKFQDFASRLLESTSTGVNGLEASRSPISEEELRSMLPDEAVTKILENLDEESSSMVAIGGDKELIIEVDKTGKYFSLTVQSKHHNSEKKEILFSFQEESDGTQRLLHLIPALYHLQNEGGTYIVDEIERSMHPLLIHKLLEFFLDNCSLAEQQLIVTTHEATLLDLDLLRRDEIWFTEKDKSGSTQLYPLTDFRTRQDLRIDKHYLQGRFGAIPYLGNLDRIFEE